ncbi:MAG: type II secretion system F family protein [Xanthomonadaceae bacterium]|nr:type II secretion system F family protein [Xanthomonadaceae bacterium]
MPQFRYKAISADGQPLNGAMDAGSADEVIARLQEAGHLPIEARRSDAVGGEGLAGLFKRNDLDRAQVLRFTQQLATLLGAGQPLDRALGILIELPETAAARGILTRVRDAVRGGAPLSTALDQQHGVFTRLYINMVRAGEAGGSLQSSLARLAEYMERSEALRARLINALIYPAILVLMVSLAILFLLGYVVPQFQAIYEGMDADLPALTRVVLWLGDLVRGGWWLILAVLAGLAWWIERRLREPATRRALDAWLLTAWLFGPLVARAETARLARTLGTLVQNGVPLLQALSIARNVLSNRILAEGVEAATEAVKGGGGLAHALARSEGFPRLAVQMIQVGEESGALDTMLLKVADAFDSETSHAIDRMLTALVPILTLVMSFVVGIVIMAILTPLYDLTSTIG